MKDGRVFKKKSYTLQELMNSTPFVSTFRYFQDHMPLYLI